MKREDWLLDHPSTVSVIACGEPSECLARLARLHGEAALQLLDIGMVPDLTVEHSARAAWRFASAAVFLAECEEVAARLALIDLDRFMA